MAKKRYGRKKQIGKINIVKKQSESHKKKTGIEKQRSEQRAREKTLDELLKPKPMPKPRKGRDVFASKAIPRANYTPKKKKDDVVKPPKIKTVKIKKERGVGKKSGLFKWTLPKKQKYLDLTEGEQAALKARGKSGLFKKMRQSMKNDKEGVAKLKELMNDDNTTQFEFKKAYLKLKAKNSIRGKKNTRDNVMYELKDYLDQIFLPEFQHAFVWVDTSKNKVNGGVDYLLTVRGRNFLKENKLNANQRKQYKNIVNFPDHNKTYKIKIFVPYSLTDDDDLSVEYEDNVLTPFIREEYRK